MIAQRYCNLSAESSLPKARDVLTGRLTNTKTICEALEKLGIDAGPEKIRFTKVSPSDMGLHFDAIIGTEPAKSGNWHWLVWDAAEKRLIDPKPSKKDCGSHSKAAFYIEIRR